MKESKGKILILGNSHLTVFGFRGELIQSLTSDGYEVTVSFPSGPFGDGKESCNQYRCNFIETPINRRGKLPAQDLILMKRYMKIMKREKPDIVLGYTVKCDVYGGIACRLTNTPFIANITGIGKGLSEGKFLKKVVVQLYKYALKKSQCVFFQNMYDRQFFKSKNINFSTGRMLPGSGVNLEKYKPLSYPNQDKIIFTYIARVMKTKGIEQFLEAARILRKECSTIEFHICGYCEEDYKEIMALEQQKGTIIYHGLVKNILDYQRISHCVVLPTFHPEGVSNVLLEAAACARPIITTDRAGCREAVDDGKTGYIVKERDTEALIEKMRMFLYLPFDEKVEMGLRGRAKIEKEFDRQIVVDAYMEEIETVIASVKH